MTYVPGTVYAVCVDTPQGRDTFVLRASTRVFDRLFPVIKNAMDGFRPAPAAGPNCPAGTVARRVKSGIQPYVCAAPVAKSDSDAGSATPAAPEESRSSGQVAPLR